MNRGEAPKVSPTPARPLSPAPRRSRVLLVDDHPVVRERMTELIDQQADLVVCGEAEDAHDALEAVHATRPDVLIADLSLKKSHGIELIKDLKNQFPHLPVLVLSMHDESLYAERVIRAGARGYVNKQEATRTILDAIRRVLAGEIYMSPTMSAAVLQRLAGQARGDNPLSALTDREMEIFQLLGQGLTTQAIARTLHIIIKTVHAHREHIKKKLGFRTSAELRRYASLAEGDRPR